MYCKGMSEQTDGTAGVESYSNTQTGQVEAGRKAGWQDRMGPYATPEDARNAYEIARKRTEAADASDRAWNAEWNGKSAGE